MQIKPNTPMYIMLESRFCLSQMPSRMIWRYLEYDALSKLKSKNDASVTGPLPT